jgi:hypothetical protein
MSTNNASSSRTPSESEFVCDVKAPTDGKDAGRVAPITDTDMDKLKRSAKIHARSLSQLGQ